MTALRLGVSGSVKHPTYVAILPDHLTESVRLPFAFDVSGPALVSGGARQRTVRHATVTPVGTILPGSWIWVISARIHFRQFLGHGHVYLESAHIQSCSYCRREQIISLDQCKMSFGSRGKIEMRIA